MKMTECPWFQCIASMVLADTNPPCKQNPLKMVLEEAMDQEAGFAYFCEVFCKAQVRLQKAWSNPHQAVKLGSQEAFAELSTALLNHHVGTFSAGGCK